VGSLRTGGPGLFRFARSCRHGGVERWGVCGPRRGWDWSADSRELFAAQAIQYAACADSAAHGDPSRFTLLDRSNDCGFGAVGVSAQGSQGAIGGFLGNEGDEATFVGHVEGVESEDFATALDLFADGDGGFVDIDLEPGFFGDFIQGAGEAAAGEVAQAV